MRRSRSGAAAIEFAIIAPVLLILLLGTVDLSNAILTARRMEVAASAIAQMASTGSAQTASLNELTDVQATEATTAAFAFFPAWARQTKPSFAITLSGISFTATPSGCTSGCSYVPNVTWSVANQLGLAELRTCGQLAVVPDTAATSLSALPTDDVGPTTIFVADLQWTFTPMFFGFIFGNIPLVESVAVSPRTGNGTSLTSAGGAGVIERC